MPDKVATKLNNTLLYELALATSTSIDLKENSSHFLKLLTEKLDFSYVSVWLREDYYYSIETKNYILFNTFPKQEVRDNLIDDDHFITKELVHNSHFVVKDDSYNFFHLLQEKNIRSGTFIIYKLDKVGFLKIYLDKGQFFKEEDRQQLLVIIQKFALFLNSSLGLERLKNETKNRIRTQEALVDTQKKYSSIIENIDEGIILTDLDGRISFMNPKMEELTGYTNREAVGHIFYELFCEEKYKPIFIDKFKERIKGISSKYEIEGIRKNGEQWIARISATPFFKEKGKIIGTVSAIIDITKRKRAEQELLEAKQKAEKARLAEQQFLTNMSHEIRTPINAVVGMTHLLYSTPLNDNQKELVDALRYSSDSLMGIVNNILDISKIEAGELAFDQKEMNLPSLVNGIGQTFQYKLKDKSIVLKIKNDPLIDSYLIGDPLRLQQILFNLLGNAFKFTKKGEIGVSTQLLAQNKTKQIIQFTVFDTGIGIAKEKLNIIFESFKQLDNSATKKHSGTGLGLAIVKQLVEMQGGTIHVESILHKGSKFIITIPFMNTNKLLGKGLDNEIHSFDYKNNDFIKQLRFLVVEDNPMNQKLASKILEHWGASFQIADNGKIALEMSQKEIFDIILMDIHMPEMDGFTATKSIRNDDKNPNQDTHIVALTAAAFVEEKIKAKEVGMNDFLTKPFSPQDLIQVLQQLEGAVEVHPLTSSKTNQDTPKELQLDLSKLKNLVNNDPTFLKDMIQIFLKDVPANMEQIKITHQQQNWIILADLVHRVKSNFMLMGMDELRRTAIDIESQLRLKPIPIQDIEQKVNFLIEKTTDMMPVLEQELSKLN